MKNLYLKGGLNLTLIISLRKKDVLLRKQALKLINLSKIPDWWFFELPIINFNKIIYRTYALHNIKNKINSQIYKSLDLILNSQSVITTMGKFILKQGLIYGPFFYCYKIYFKMLRVFLNKIVPIGDNFYITINYIIYSEGSFWYIPKNIFWVFELNTYFITSAENSAQFEKTLIVVNKNSLLYYIEGCSAPVYIESQLHIASVEVLLKYNWICNYTTIQNWYRGTNMGEGGVYNYTTKRSIVNTLSYMIWCQIEVGSYITWKYPSSIIIGEKSKSIMSSLTFTSNIQNVDTGFKVINSADLFSSYIVSKSMSMNHSVNVFRCLSSTSKYSNSTIECSSIIIGSNSIISTIPYIKVKGNYPLLSQETFLSVIDYIYIFLYGSRGINLKLALNLIIFKFFINTYKLIPSNIFNEISYLLLARLEEWVI